jgi:hypothetical protein
MFKFTMVTVLSVLEGSQVAMFRPLMGICETPVVQFQSSTAIWAQ